MRRIQSSSASPCRRYLSRPLADKVKTWFISCLHYAAFSFLSFATCGLLIASENQNHTEQPMWPLVLLSYIWISFNFIRSSYSFCFFFLTHLASLNNFYWIYSLFIEENVGTQLISQFLHSSRDIFSNYIYYTYLIKKHFFSCKHLIDKNKIFNDKCFYILHFNCVKKLFWID